MSKAKQDRTRSLYFHNRITQALDGILVHPLTIVEAHMGYGKNDALEFKPIEIEAYYKECGINIKTAEADSIFTGFLREVQ